MKSYFFYIKNPDINDYNLLLNHALSIRDEKNRVSKIIHKSYKKELFFNELSDYDLISELKDFREIKDSVAYQQLVKQVYSNYQTIFSNISIKYDKKIEFISEKQFMVKLKISNKFEMLNELKKLQKNKTYDQELIQSCMDNFESLFEFVHKYQIKWISKIRPPEYKSLTYSSINDLPKDQRTIVENHSKDFNCKIIINIPNQGILEFKSRYSIKNQGSLDSFEYSNWYRTLKSGEKKLAKTKINYSVKFLENKKLKFIFTKDIKNEINYQRQKINPERVLGVDLNTKHNIAKFSDNQEILPDERLLKKELNLQLKLRQRDRNIKKNRNKSKIHGKQIRLREEKQERRRFYHENLIGSKIVRYAKENNYSIVVMEDLNLRNNSGFKMREKDKNGNKIETYLTLKHHEKALHLDNIKNIVQRLCLKEEIQFCLVNSRYTSKTCSHCGHIDDENRKSQENFCCTKCGFSTNADYNSALNIRDRIAIPKLRTMFEYFDKKNHIYKGKGFLSKKKFQDIYDSYYN